MYSNELICNVINYLDKNMYSEISIDLLSSIFCYDKYYIMKKFKKEIGITIISYINSMKIFKSLDYFKYDVNILSITFDNGFNSLEYFSETFKNIMGVSPVCYRKFIKYRMNVDDNDIKSIVDSLIRLKSLVSFVESYKRRVKPKDVPVKKLSIFK